jgi:hypothetical protein
MTRGTLRISPAQALLLVPAAWLAFVGWAGCVTERNPAADGWCCAGGFCRPPTDAEMAAKGVFGQCVPWCPKDDAGMCIDGGTASDGARAADARADAANPAIEDAPVDVPSSDAAVDGGGQ